MSKMVLIFGSMLLVIGLIAYFYPDTNLRPYRYPYQTMGIILTLAGIFFAGLSFVIKEKKANPQAMQEG